MIYKDDEVAGGLELLGKYPEARYLHQVLLKAILEAPGDAGQRGAVRSFLARHNFASELIKALGLEARNDGPTAAELIGRPVQRERVADRRQLRRPAAPE